MEEYMTFVETCSPFLLLNLPWKPEDKDVKTMFERQWGSLRRAVLFCLRQQDCRHHTPERLARARRDFEEYAFAAQEVRFMSICLIICCADRCLLFESLPDPFLEAVVAGLIRPICIRLSSGILGDSHCCRLFEG